MSSEGLEVEGLTLAHGDVVAVRDASLSVAPGRIVALLGPSGCGKSTLLRGIAGLHAPERGRVSWRGSDITSVPTHRRNVGLMFQDHALFPHKNVADNVGFGLRMAGVDRAQRNARVESLLELVGLPGMGERSVDTLSGGQAQRVALARALAPEPDLLLLDEPLGSLDRALRDHLTHEIRSIVGQLGMTTVHVTHDHDEAITIADDLALMEDGRVTASGTVAELLDHPPDVAAAQALRLENLFPTSGAARVVTPFGDVVVGESTGAILLRPTDIWIGDSGVEATVTGARFRGDAWHLVCRVQGGEVTVRSSSRLTDGTVVRLDADRERAQPIPR